jgi:hypothetical protein
MLIQIDIDSTLIDSDKLFGDLAEEAGIKWPRRDAEWKTATDIYKLDGTPCLREDLSKIFRKAHSREVMLTQKPYKDAVECLHGIANDYDRIEIAYVSDRNEQQIAALREWLEINGFLRDEETHVEATRDKRHWMRERKPEIVIDDRVRTMLLAKFELGSQVASLKHNHNRNLKGEVDDIYIVDSWKEIDDVLRNIILPKLDAKQLSRI